MIFAGSALHYMMVSVMPTNIIGGTHSAQRGKWRLVLSMPFIYGISLPIAIFDLSVSVYQYVCFPLYGIPCVSRRTYVRAGTRGKGMLTPLDRFNCWYCGYASGVIEYARVVVAETERYWCPLRHAKMSGFIEPAYHKEFVPDKDPDALRKKLTENTKRRE